MKRDWDTVRLILRTMEEKQADPFIIGLDSFDVVDEQRAYELSNHARMLLEARLVEGKIQTSIGGGGPADFALLRLTWAGHDFLDSIRNETVWDKTKETFVSKGLDMTYETIKAVAVGVAVKILGLP